MAAGADHHTLFDFFLDRLKRIAITDKFSDFPLLPSTDVMKLQNGRVVFPAIDAGITGQMIPDVLSGTLPLIQLVPVGVLLVGVFVLLITRPASAHSDSRGMSAV